MKKISFSSTDFKILATCCAFGTSMLVIVTLFLADEFNLVAILFSIFASCFCIFGTFLLFNHSVRFKGKILIVKQIKTIKINTEDILDININDETLLNDNVIFIKTKTKVY